ncbi:ATP-dependent DNA ligase [uncultured Methanomethylovorans sp.]|uniref:ATP-dependent DNA ligase n=1 Tax=uncultured Methanomethylovorans sp. TaxID=183759 RepID=UPI0026175AC4|nr:ATP-dependent DNA ligase [uncultured Methanomethylovorans sp.]
MTSFREFCRICKIIEETAGSLDMTGLVSELFSLVTSEELPIVTHFVMGEVFPAWTDEEVGLGTGILINALSRSSGLSIKEIEDIVRETGDIGKTTVKALGKVSKGQVTFSSFLDSPAELSIMEVFERFRDIAHATGKGSQTSKIKHLQYLFNSASVEEVSYIARLAIEDMRIGVGEGIVRDAIAKAFNVPVASVERGYMLTNDMGLVAVTAKEGGNEALLNLGLQVGRPIKLMLAQVTPDIETAIRELGVVAAEWKFDGARVQIHKKGDTVTLYSRRLENITGSLPDIVSAVKTAVKADSAILDGEAVAIDEDGRPKPFQEILKRFRRKYDVQNKVRHIPLTLNLFDIMYLNGDSLIELPLQKRREFLVSSIGDSDLVHVDNQLITSDISQINCMYEQALQAGHEGIMIKNPGSPYSPGKRGKNWLKKKPVMETLDLVVIGAEWGYGRRTSFLGSFALACHDPETGRFLSVGKVATGISDEQLAELTELFREHIISESGTSVEIRPHVLFEVAFEEIQKSTNYGSGYALRFPRLVRVRDDKSLEEADTLERLEDMYRTQRK